MNKGLGRLIRPDVRNVKYPLRAQTEEPPKTGSKRHYINGWWGDQDQTSECVTFAGVHLLEAGPITFPQKGSILDPHVLYVEAQKRDEWPGEGYDGTSALGLCKYLKELGIISAYHWGFTLEDMIRAVFERPVLFGQTWYSDMYNPNKDGFVTPTGKVEGGHETVVVGVDMDDKYFDLKNSWGYEKYTHTPTWGYKGRYKLTFEHMDALIKDYGDMVIVDEVKGWREKTYKDAVQE